MILVSNINVGHDFDFENPEVYLAQYLKINESDILFLELKKRSVDARRKNRVQFCCSFLVDLKNESAFLKQNTNKSITLYNKKEYTLKKAEKLGKRPVVVGFGPAGMFAALALAYAGLKPIVIERGADVDARVRDIESFFSKEKLNPNSNIQFGEGGAGTFSDGKLTTGISNERIPFVLEQFIDCGADKSILYSSKSHIGTDVLRVVVKNLRKKIISLGGEVRFNSKFIDYTENGERLASVIIEDKNGHYELLCDSLILAIGHSSRDTYRMLYSKKLPMCQKAFSLGARIEHKQAWLDTAQLGDFAKLNVFPKSDYKLACHLKNGRGVYTFCMCPGGTVVNASSEEGKITTNGMSNFMREKENCNSAVLVSVTPEDFKTDDALEGMYLQEEVEKAAYDISNSYKAPAQRVEDFLENRPTEHFGSIQPTFLPAVTKARIDDCLPQFVTDALREALPIFDKKIKGFLNPDAVLTAPETRSSAPLRILRDESYMTKTKGIFPCGEGAGYAGGIMSSAVDGLTVAEAVLIWEENL